MITTETYCSVCSLNTGNFLPGNYPRILNHKDLEQCISSLGHAFTELRLSQRKWIAKEVTYRVSRLELAKERRRWRNENRKPVKK